MILVDQIERNRADGLPTWQAIIEAAVRRLVPREAAGRGRGGWGADHAARLGYQSKAIE